MTNKMVLAIEIPKVEYQPGLCNSMVQTASKMKNTAHINSRWRGMRNTLQNKKKWPTVNAIAIASPKSISVTKKVPIAPAINTIVSVIDRRKPGLNCAEAIL
jgi:hypothetical protein